MSRLKAAGHSLSEEKKFGEVKERVVDGENSSKGCSWNRSESAVYQNHSHRFQVSVPSPSKIQYALWDCKRFLLCHRNVEVRAVYPCQIGLWQKHATLCGLLSFCQHTVR